MINRKANDTCQFLALSRATKQRFGYEILAYSILASNVPVLVKVSVDSEALC